MFTLLTIIILSNLSIKTYDASYTFVKLLIENGADVHADRDQSLDAVADTGDYKMVKLLLKNGASARHSTAIPIADENGYYSIVMLLQNSLAIADDSYDDDDYDDDDYYNNLYNGNDNNEKIYSN